MLYDRDTGPIRPFHEDERRYIFRYFCSNSSIPGEQSMPKSDPHYVCHCGILMVIEEDSEGPWLRFGEHSQRHFAAKPRPRSGRD
jgi:hypothetical protein